MSKTLIVGTGPVAIQLGNICNQHTNQVIDMVCRASTSTKSNQLYKAYQRDGYFEVESQNHSHYHLKGRFTINQLYRDLDKVDDVYHTMIMACTADAYLNVLRQLSTEVLKSMKCIILVSPTFGSQMIIEQFMIEINKEIEVISFSTYIGDTRISDIASPNRVLTTGMKKKLYVGSNKSNSLIIDVIRNVFNALSITLEVMDTPLYAETRNSSLYVHPPLFMNDFSLKVIFEGSDVPVYVYKLFPEGPITMKLIKEMRLMWREIMCVLKKMNLPSINLLKFMVKENYPVRPETLSSKDIEQFESLPDKFQEYLLYVRYTAILIDPFSKPNHKGRYFDFSSVPFKSIYINEDNITYIPRMPSEDYYRTSIIQHIGKILDVDTPMIDLFLKRYTAHCEQYRVTHPLQQLSDQFKNYTFTDDQSLITQYLKSKNIMTSNEC
ncbi:staphylopine biosynthesis dehydrogenase [Mammaliicoccus sciuri]|uniref:Staphylopine biosynthesis dehydrogenase n=1 Tax=Mammaliicoccus sciuri TaxID=1296 RepID=A0AAJ4VIJ2_MAMSC|nr:staphylopine biosynthesis dehydrogenase [Mammaliicoccus sciuri]RTX74081.1 staphylopine biosynthesis dehydrogenase [Mammaliicoccus sciuri]